MKRILALLLVCLIPLPAQAESPALNWICLDMDKRFCAYEANRDADQSVVLVHGLNGSALDDWKPQIALLAKSYHVLAIELPGFEQENQDASHYSMAYFSEVIRRFTSRFIDEPYYLVGHSMGGAIALRHALYYPDRVKRLVLSDVAGVLHRVSYSREIVGNWVRGGVGEHSGFSAFMEKMTLKFMGSAEELPGTDESANEILLDQTSNPIALASMQLVRQDYSGQLLGMWVPTLLIWGEQDPIAPLRTGYALNARLPNARLHIIPDAKHLPMREQPEAFNQALLGFLQANGAAPGQDKYFVVPQGENNSKRVAICDKEADKVYQGDYARIELRSCERVVIRNARVKSLQVYHSRISVEHSDIGSKESPVALEADGADIKITASRVQGDTAMSLNGSRIDLAGSTLCVRSRAAVARRSSDLVISVSELNTPGYSHYLHGFYKLGHHHSLTLEGDIKRLSGSSPAERRQGDAVRQLAEPEPPA